MKNLKRFVFAFIIMIALSQSVTSPEKVVSPLPEHQNVFDSVKAKLHARVNAYKVSQDRSIIPAVHAESVVADVHAYGVIDYDTGEVLEESNFSAQIPIASITKVMTGVVALDLASPDELFTVSEYAASIMPTKIGVIPGQKMKLYDLLQAALLTSANDATQVIAEGIDAKYGEKVFIKSMNEKAKFLKLENSYFTNPQGFDTRHPYSSVEDLAILTHYAMQYPIIAEIVEKDKAYLPETATHKPYHLPNWNGLIGVYPNTFGMKIGNTNRAGYTTVVLSEREGKRMMTIVLGANSITERDLVAAELLDTGFQRKYGLKPVGITQADLQAKYATWSY